MTVLVRPMAADRWADLEHVFAARARRADSCWCQRFRAHEHRNNRAALGQEVATTTEAIGLLGYINDEPVGWTRVQPRTSLPGITGNRALEQLLDDDQHAWWVTCFVVRREYRGRGVGEELLLAAVDWARDHGGSVLDGHPVDVAALKATPAPSAVFTGTLAMFAHAGFTEVGRTFASRPVMRRLLKGMVDSDARPGGRGHQRRSD